MSLPDDFYDRGFNELGKWGWNEVAKRIRQKGFGDHDFTRKKGETEYSGSTLTHKATNRWIQWSVDFGSEGHWFIVDSESFRRFGEEAGALIKSNGDFFFHVERWLQLLREHIEEESETDLWEFASSPPNDALTVRDELTVFTTEEASYIHERVQEALEEIKQRQLLTPEAFNELADEAYDRVPVKGDNWRKWRDEIVSWGLGKVLDGVTSPDVIKYIFFAVGGYLSAKVGLPHMPQLPPTF